MKVRSRVARAVVSIAGFNSGEESEASNVLIDVDDAARCAYLHRQYDGVRWLRSAPG